MKYSVYYREKSISPVNGLFCIINGILHLNGTFYATSPIILYDTIEKRLTICLQWKSDIKFQSKIMLHTDFCFEQTKFTHIRVAY